MKLYSYFVSSAAYRVRIALHLKGVDYTLTAVDLRKHGGEQLAASYRAIHPGALVPALELDPGDGAGAPAILTQSLAIIEYLDETCPGPRLLPTEPLGRARVRAIAQAIACDIHPLNNLRVLRYLVRDLGVDAGKKDAWYRHWCEQGLATVERMLANDPRTGAFCHGDAPTLADCCLVPQVANAMRAGCDLSAMPTVAAIDARCRALDPFGRAAPENQPDAPH